MILLPTAFISASALRRFDGAAMRKIHADEFPAAYAIMEEAFSKDEIRSYAGQEGLLARSEYDLFVEADGAALEAVVALWRFDGFGYLENFAVRKELRGHGMGSGMLRELADICQGRIILEVEKPDTELARRRIGFYKRCGFFMNDYDYVMPPLEPGLNPVPLLIMSYGSELSPDEFEHFRSTVFREVFGV